MNSGFVKIHRQVKHHEWLTSRPEWFMGWVYIIINTNYETGYVNLTETFRELADHFNRQSWNRFVDKLVESGMLNNVVSKNCGRGIGHITTAIVTNYYKYHRKADSKTDSKRTASDTVNGQRNGQRNVVQDDDIAVSSDSTMDSKRTASDTVNGQQNGQSNKNIFLKEVKEVKEVKTYIGASRLSAQNQDDLKTITLASAGNIVDEQSATRTPTRQHEDFPAARENFYKLWNERKPALSAALSSNRAVDAQAKFHIKRLGAAEFLRRADLALDFINADEFHTVTRPCPPITLLRHLDSYAEQGQNRRENPIARFAGSSAANAKFAAYLLRGKAALDSLDQKREGFLTNGG